MKDTCDNIQCSKADTCQRYLPWEPCTLPYEVGKEVNCEYYLPTNEKQEPKELNLFEI